jgi:CheY-like chemotaxis protein
MSKIYILLVEDEPEVLDVIVKDLKNFELSFPLETAHSVTEARKIVRDIIEKGDMIGLFLCDHIMPNENGVDFLVEMQKDEITKRSKKVLLTGQAGLEATIKAINEAELNNYISKPWKKEELLNIVKNNLTDFVIANTKDIMQYMSILDGSKIAQALRSNLSQND